MKDLILKCDCVGKCSKLRAIDYGDKCVEIQVKGDGVFLSEKHIEKLIEYLTNLTNKV